MRSVNAPIARSHSVARAPLLGFWACTALIIGNCIGSGVFLLPAALAPFGANNLPAWLFTAAGAMALALVFASLSHAYPKAGGPYAYAHAAFGPFAAFIVAWGYWISIWVGNAAIATGTVSYLVPLLPSLGRLPAAAASVTLLMLWSLTGVNAYGIRASARVQGITTILKVLPLVAVAMLGLWLHPGGAAAHEPWSLGGTTAAATLALWTLLGLESATIPAGKVHDPGRTIPRATLAGTLATAALCGLACCTVLLLLPPSLAAQSNAPFVDVARRFWGGWAGDVMALMAAISGFGALNGWVLLQGELPQAMARDGVFPRIFATESARGTPAFALTFSSLLVSVLILANYHKSMVKVFTFMILLSTTACLVMYAVCSLALLRLQWTGRLGPARRHTLPLALAGMAAALYSFWAIAGAGPEALSWGCVLLALGAPVYWLVRRT
jgi:APA family basic amino acid/polyamine antiporter